jgi:hypothetical protein
MIKETVGIAGVSALLLPPLGIACLACGLPGLLVAGAGLFITENMAKDYKERNGLSGPRTDVHGATQDSQDDLA